MKIIDRNLFTLRTSVAADPYKSGYIPALDGLRAFAILSVLVYHAIASVLSGGFIGVDIFFTLSGFLITALLIREWDRSENIDFKNFYARRALRLLPALVALLLVYVLTSFLFLEKITNQSVPDNLLDAFIVLFYASNWTLALGLGRPQMLGHAWSLSIEEQFYILWPLTLLFILRLIPSRCWIVAILLSAAFLSFLHRVQMLSTGASSWRLYFGLDTRLDSLLIGCALGVIFSSNLLPSGRWMPAFTNYTALASMFGLLILIKVSVWENSSTPYVVFVLTAVFTMFIILNLTSPYRSTLRNILEIPLLVGIGKISYGLYLWHFPIFFVMKQLHWWGPVVLAIGGTLTFVIAILSYHFLEKPFPLLSAKLSFAGVGNMV